MTERNSGQAGRRNRLLAIAFGLILVAQIGLYFAASLDSGLGTWGLMVMLGAGMLLALWAA